MKAMQMGKLAEAQQLLTAKADANYIEAGGNRMCALHYAVNLGYNSIDAVDLLFKARANPNALTVSRQTPLHLAIGNCATIPSLVFRMLLCHKADLHVADSEGLTPLHLIRNDRGPAKSMLQEVPQLSILDVWVVEGQKKVLSAEFMDMRNDKVVFSTDSSIGIYSLAQKSALSMKRLIQHHQQTMVRHVSVNPELGTIAVCLEITEQTSRGEQVTQNVFIIWPDGNLQDSEPLKLSINVENPLLQPEGFPACAILSRSTGPQFLLGRLVDGQVYSWRLNEERSTLTGEEALVPNKNAGAVAASDDGLWIGAVVNEGERCWLNGGPYGAAAARLLAKPKKVYVTSKSICGIAVQQSQSRNSCYLAIVEPAGQRRDLPPIEIWSVSIDAATSHPSILFRLTIASQCVSLRFCHNSATHLLSGHADGQSVLYDLDAKCTQHQNMGNQMASISISPDRQIMVCTELDCFSIFHAPPMALPA